MSAMHDIDRGARIWCAAMSDNMTNGRNVARHMWQALDEHRQGRLPGSAFAVNDRTIHLAYGHESFDPMEDAGWLAVASNTISDMVRDFRDQVAEAQASR